MSDLPSSTSPPALPSQPDHPSLSKTQEGEPVMSKTMLKKLAKRERMLAGRLEKRKLEKERKKLKRQELAKLRSELDPDSIPPPKRHTLMKDSTNKIRIVIDMDFEDYMTDSEIAQAAKQIGRIYSLNRHSPSPCQLYMTSVRGRIRDRFAITNRGFENWDINCSELDYEQIFSEQGSTKSDFVYLSGDAEAVLPAVDTMLADSGKIYVIGGLVDHNRHKNLCHIRATERGIPTARLPIKENVTLCQRHILSTVAVFEILLNIFGSHKQWPESLLECIPKRKIAEPTVKAITEETRREERGPEESDNDSENDCGEPDEESTNNIKRPADDAASTTVD